MEVSKETRERHDAEVAEIAKKMTLMQKVKAKAEAASLRPFSILRNTDSISFILVTVFAVVSSFCFVSGHYKTTIATATGSTLSYMAFIFSNKGDFAQYLKLLLLEIAKFTIDYFKKEQQRKEEIEKVQDESALSLTKRIQ